MRMRILQYLSDLIGTPVRIFQRQSADILEAECRELEHIFALLVAAPVIGIPGSPLPITFALLPYMEDELAALLDDADVAEYPLSYLFSIFKTS